MNPSTDQFLLNKGITSKQVFCISLQAAILNPEYATKCNTFTNYYNALQTADDDNYDYAETSPLPTLHHPQISSEFNENLDEKPSTAFHKDTDL
jgi:hypothetical protein